MPDSASIRHPTRDLRQTWLPALALALAAAAPRLVRPDLAEYKLDESIAVLNAHAILHGQALPIQGQGSSLAGAAQGPLFYYLVAGALALGHDPRAVVVAIGLANALAVGLSYVVVARAFNRRIGLVAAILFAGSSWSIIFSRKIWPNDLLAPLAVVALWGLLRALDSRSRRPCLGVSWVAVAAMGSLNLSAWPLAAVPALVLILVPRARRGWALIESLVGVAVMIVGVAIQAPTFLVIATDLTARSGPARTLDLSPLSFIVQLAGTDAFQYLAGPAGTVTSTGDLNWWVGRALRVALFLGAAVAVGKTVQAWRKQGRPVLTAESLILIWWVAPAVAAVYRPVPVFIHHFLATMPSQFILVALGLDWLTGLVSVGPFLSVVGPAVAGLFAVGAFVAQVRVFVLLLAFVQAHPAGTFFGVPLGSSLDAARAVSAASQHGPVYVLSNGDLVGVDDTPTVMASLTDGAPLSFLNVERTVLLPASATATYFVAPDSVDDLGDVLRPWQTPTGVFSAPTILAGGYQRFEGRPLDERLPRGWQALNIITADRGLLLGYYAPRQIQPDVPFAVDVLWRIGTPAARPDLQSVFVHLVDDNGQVLDQQDFAPLPTTTWVTGVGVINRFHLTAPMDLPGGRYWLDFGRYRRPGIQPVRLLGSDGQPGPSSIRLGPLSVPPNLVVPPDLQPGDAAFGGQIKLTGWKVQQKQEQLVVGLLWKAIKPPADDYTVFIHVVRSDGKVVAQNDGQPYLGEFPTHTWKTNDQAFDVHQIPLMGLPTGDYRVDVGLYTLATGHRLPVDDTTSFSLGMVHVSAVPAG